MQDTGNCFQPKDIIKQLGVLWEIREPKSEKVKVPWPKRYRLLD